MLLVKSDGQIYNEFGMLMAISYAAACDEVKVASRQAASFALDASMHAGGERSAASVDGKARAMRMETVTKSKGGTVKSAQ